MAAFGVDEGGLDGVGDVATRAGGVRAGRAGKMKNSVRFRVKGLGDVMLDERKPGVLDKVGDVGPRTGDEVVGAKNAGAFGEKAVAQVGADEPRASGYDCPHEPNSTSPVWRRRPPLAHDNEERNE